MEFVDANPALPRVLGNHLEDGLGPVKTSTQGPWRSQSPTQVGSITLVMRYQLVGEEALAHAPRKFGIRLVEGYEHMRMSGWDDDAWNLDPNLKQPMSAEDVFRLMNMAGNAYSVWHWLPWTLSLLSTFGKFIDASNEVESGDSGSHDGDASSIEPPDSP